MADAVDPFIDYCRTELRNGPETTETKKRNLMRFFRFLESEKLKLDDLNVESIDGFILSLGLGIGSMNDCRRLLVSFFTFCFDRGFMERNYAGYVATGKKEEPEKVIDVYTEEEIGKILVSAERGSAIGKRNYVVLLLASVYGLRAGDITKLSLSNIDWKNNRIILSQSKTGEPLELPLVAAVGNAIIDYCRNGRPDGKPDTPIILSHMKSTIGAPINHSTIHSIVRDAMRNANIANWESKKHGPHSLRHSLATSLLRKNASMPIISTILGHRSTETTNAYISVDIDRLKQCAVKMPAVSSSQYQNLPGGAR